jgi:hypothetical protein
MNEQCGNAKCEPELKSLLSELNSEKNRIKELNGLINSKVNEFHATLLPLSSTDKQPQYPGILGELKTLIVEIAGQRELMEITLKELSTIVG